MERGDVARLFNVAEADVTGVVETDETVLVTLKDGVQRICTEDGIFGVSDHPSNRQLRRWDKPLPGAVAEDADAEDGEALAEPDEDTADEDTADEAPAVEAAVDVVPDGSAKDVMAWVDDDQARAEQAKAAELERDNPRSTLLKQLDGVLES